MQDFLAGFDDQIQAALAWTAARPGRRSLTPAYLTHLPPVTSRNVPVTNDASALANHKIARATSSG